MVAPTAVAIRGWSKVNFDPLGYEEDSDLERIVKRAGAVMQNVTGQTWEGMPELLEPLAEQVVQMLTEQIAMQSQEEIAETGADFALISSFSAGSYTETRRALSEFAYKNKMLNSNPLINELLMDLMTEEKREEWVELMTGVVRPEFAVTEVDWNFDAGRYDILPGEAG